MIEAAEAAPPQAGALRWPAGRGPRVAIGIALAVNLLLLLAYLWSRGGQTTHLRIEARGDEIAVFVDGREQARETLDIEPSGGILLELADTHNVPSLPSPRGIDRVRVTDLDTGEALFEDRFSSPPGDDEWEERTGAFTLDDGVLGVRGSGRLATGDRPWGDYAVDVTYRNITSAEVIVRVGEGRSGAVTTIRPFWWNRDDSGTLSLGAGGPGLHTPGQIVELDKSESVRMALAMALRPYPYMVLVLLAGIALVVALATLPLRIGDAVTRSARAVPAGWAVGALAYAAFGLTLYFNYSYLQHMPHVPDEVAYVFQAKILASGHFAADSPPVYEAFEFIKPSFVQAFDGNFAAVYPFGHPLMLAVGELFGAAWLVPPLIGAATIVLLFLLGRRWFGAGTGAVAAVLLATSPFFLMNASSFMSHNTAAFYFVASLLAIAHLDRAGRTRGSAPTSHEMQWPVAMGLLAGLAFGLFFNTRPLTALAAAPAVGLLLLTTVARLPRRCAVASVVAVIAGGLIMVGAYLLYNYGTTGEVFASGYQASGDPSQQVGFGGAHSVAAGIQNEQTQLASLLLVLHGWPAWVGLGLVLLPFALGTRDGRDWFLLGCALLMMSAWAWFEGVGLMYGPRYWYETAPLLMLLAARGAARGSDAMASVAGSIVSLRRRGGIRGLDAVGDERIRPLARLVVYAFVAALVGSSIYGWLLGQHTTWKADFVPEKATAMRGFLGMDDRIHRMVEERGLHNALVLVEDCTQFQCYGSVFWRNSPGLDGDVVYAKDVAALREEIIAAYPGREVWVAKYTVPSLEPYRARQP